MKHIRLVVFLLSIFLVWQLSAVYISFVTCTRKVVMKEKEHIQQIVVLGDKPLCPDCNNEGEYRRENEQTSLLQESIKLFASGDVPIAFVVDSSLSGVQMALDALTQVDHSIISDIHVSLPIKMAFVCDKYSKQYVNIDFFYADRRGKPIISLLQAFDILNQTIGFFKVQGIRYNLDVIGGQEHYEQQAAIKKKIFAKESRVSRIKKRFFSLASDVTVGQFIKKIEKILKKIPKDSTLSAIRKGDLCSHARSFVHGYEADVVLKQVVWDTFENEENGQLNSHIHTWVFPLSNFILQDGMEHLFEKLITKYRMIIFSCNHNHSLWLYDFFYSQKFTPFHVAGTSYNATAHSEPLHQDLLRKSMYVIAKNVQSTRVIQCCNHCMKPEAVGEHFSYCGNCKVTYYCSRECQSHHWHIHKAICKELSKKAADNKKIMPEHHKYS